MAQLGRIPKGGETFEYQNRRYTVLNMEGHRIARVKIETVGQTAPLKPTG